MKTKRHIKIYWLFVVFLLLSRMTTAQEASLKEAEIAYTKEDYKTAIELYEGILKNNGESEAVYYNLGNAYYKDGQIAPAILNYERALLLQPGDKDVRFNLQIAKQRAVDKIEPLGHFFLSDLFSSIRDIASADTWGGIGIACFLLLIFCLVVFFFSKIVRFKKIAFYAGLFLVIIVIASNILGYSQVKALKEHSEAIVFAPSVTMKSSPDASGTDLVVLHEGTKVAVRSTLGDWSEIELEDGNVGWMPTKDIVKI